MGLKDLLQQQGSTLAYGANPTTPTNGDDISINPLATKYSTLHYDPKTNTEGWSVGGKLDQAGLQAIQNYALYQDGVYNPIPNPTSLELNDPEGADPNYKPLYTSAEGKRYEDLNFK